MNFDELVHRRMENILEGLQEMVQSQEYKGRQQQQQLGGIEHDLGS